ncbi:hypothetical protein K438DRAFT_1972440 [Mycena galopus ATCC 62051]|nr:hypothetical protein K438DRAFT_1972440 [Mycena galopus ATCC 62051]
MYPPSNVDKPRTASSYAGVPPRALRNRLAEIDGQTADLQEKLLRLAAERKPIAEALQSVIYPILTLPSEITAEVFIQYVDNPYIGGTDPILFPPDSDSTPGSSPLLLASVCRAWRDIALALRPIWSSIRLRTSEHAIPSTEKLLQCWLPRSGGHPLDISMARSADVRDVLCTFLAPYFPQVQKFFCSVYIPVTFPSDLLRGRVPCLRRLVAELNAFPEDLDGLPSPLTAFADAPELREVTLSNFPLQWIALPWVQLTKLELIGQSPNKAVEILHGTPNLDTLSLQLVDLLDMPDMPPTPVQLAHLHTLVFHEYHQSNIHILDHTTLPALEHLELSAVPRSMSTRFAAFIARSGCVLRSIAFIAVDSNPVVDFLRVVPTVSVVRVKNASWNFSYNHFFEIIAHEPQFIPNVRFLSINPCMRAVEIPYAVVAAMLASRWHGRGDGDGGVRLESFELVIAPANSFEPVPNVAEVQQGLDALRALEADGLKINIRSLQRLTGTVDATALCPPAHLRTILYK